MYARFQCNPSKEYKIADGTTFTSVMGEELDSGTIIIPQVFSEDRLTNLTPYSYVRVNGVLYLVDNFVETKIDLKNHIYSYTIDLMSETKLLEKIQLPNKSFTHSLTSGAKTISEAISDLVYCYAPYVKVEFKDNDNYWWEYQQVFQLLNSNIPSIFKNTKVKDLSMSKPTLRQAITAITTQVGYLPYLKERRLRFMKLGDNGVIFNSTGVLSITRSMASDSFLTNIQCINDNVLDEGNYTRNEIIGFRDRDNAILKQKENCFLTTDLPIYEVKKLTCGFYLNIKQLHLKARTSPNNDDGTTMTYQHENLFRVKFNYTSETQEKAIYNLHTFDDMDMPDYEYITYKSISNIVVKHLSKDGNGFLVDFVEKFDKEQVGLEDVFYFSDSNRMCVITYTLTYHYKYECAKSTYGGATGDLHKEYDEDRTLECGMFAFGVNNINTYDVQNMTGMVDGIDITSLVYEKNKRKLLSVDYTDIEETISGMSKNYYTTLEYEIGGNTIKGFSNTWNLAVAWWNEEHTMGEMLTKVLLHYYSMYLDLGKYFGYLPNGCFSLKDYSAELSSDYYTSLFFSIEYLPLNTLNIKVDKDDKDEIIPLSQLDTQSSGFTSLDNLTLVEQDNINRFGNNMLVITQRLTDLSKASNIGNLYGKSIIFKKEIAYYNDYYIIQYYASEDYVIKNYSTSIATTYRAYQNVDYSQSVERVENVKMYLLIAPYYVNGSRLNKISDLSALFLNTSNYNKLTSAVMYMGYDKNKYGYFKYDLSVVSNNNSIFLNFSERDNVSAGAHISSNGYNEKLGGLQQEYYMYTDASLYSASTLIYFVPNIENIDRLVDHYDNIYEAPAFKEPLTNITNITKGISVVAYTERDLSERFTFTIQLEYYVSDKSLVQFNSWLPKTSAFLMKNVEYRAVLHKGKINEDLTENPHYDMVLEDTEPLSNYVSDIESNEYYAKITFKQKYLKTDVHWLRVFYYNKEDDELFEVIRFNLVNDIYYLSMNDTKTLKLLNYDDYDVPTTEHNLKVDTENRKRA